MNKSEMKRVNRLFDLQIKKERIMQGIDRTRSWYEKQLFNLTLNFTIADWRSLRNKQYWLTLDELNGEMEQLQFKLQAVEYYLSKKQNQ